MTRRLRRELGLVVRWGTHTFLSMAKEKCTKESQRHGDFRGGPRRYAPWASVCGSPSGCPRARGVRCRIAPCRSLCSPPTFPAGRFGLRPRPHRGHTSLRDSSLRSPAGKKASIAHFDGGARNVARNLVSELPPSFVRARSSPFSTVKMGGPFSLRCLSPLCSPAVGVGHTYLLRLERVLATWLFCHAKKGGLCFPTVDGGQAYPLRGGILSWQQRPACVLLHAGLFSEP